MQPHFMQPLQIRPPHGPKQTKSRQKTSRSSVDHGAHYKSEIIHSGSLQHHPSAAGLNNLKTTQYNVNVSLQAFILH